MPVTRNVVTNSSAITCITEDFVMRKYVGICTATSVAQGSTMCCRTSITYAQPV